MKAEGIIVDNKASVFGKTELKQWHVVDNPSNLQLITDFFVDCVQAAQEPCSENSCPTPITPSVPVSRSKLTLHAPPFDTVQRDSLLFSFFVNGSDHTLGR